MHSSSKLYKDYHSDVFGIPIPWKVEDMKMPNEQTQKYDRPIRLEWRKDLGGTSDQEDLKLNGKIKTNDELYPNDEKEVEILKNRLEITKGLLRDGLVFVKGLDNVRTGSEMGKDGIGKVARLKDLAEIVSSKFAELLFFFRLFLDPNRLKKCCKRISPDLFLSFFR